MLYQILIKISIILRFIEDFEAKLKAIITKLLIKEAYLLFIFNLLGVLASMVYSGRIITLVFIIVITLHLGFIAILEPIIEEPNLKFAFVRKASELPMVYLKLVLN